jgi:hypothetical protein
VFLRSKLFEAEELNVEVLRVPVFRVPVLRMPVLLVEIVVLVKLVAIEEEVEDLVVVIEYVFEELIALDVVLIVLAVMV